MMGIQNVAGIFCIPLIPYCWDTKYGSHILYSLKDQMGDTEYGRHTEYGVTPVLCLEKGYDQLVSDTFLVL